MASDSTGSGLTPRDMAVVAAINVLWGLNIIAVKFTVEDVPPMTAAALRMAMVFAICASAIRIVPGKMRDILIFGALIGGLFLALVNYSLVVADNVSALAIAGQLGTPFALVLGVVFLGERIGLPRLAGIALALSGVMLLVFDPAMARELPGIGITVIASMAWAAASVFQRRLKDVPVRVIYGWMGLIGMITLAPMIAIFEPAPLATMARAPLAAYGWIAFSALGSTMIGYGGMTWLLQRHPVSMVVPLMLGAPVISVIASSIVFDTPLTGAMILGGTMAMTGVAIISIRSVRVPKPPVAP